MKYVRDRLGVVLGTSFRGLATINKPAPNMHHGRFKELTMRPGTDNANDDRAGTPREVAQDCRAL
jgi:hypothetical protein